MLTKSRLNHIKDHITEFDLQKAVPISGESAILPTRYRHREGGSNKTLSDQVNRQEKTP